MVVVPRSFNKEVVRSIGGTLSRFVAIAAIVALGTGFYAGLRMTGPDMDIAADRYYDGTDLMDIRVVSTMGLTDDDIAALREVDGVENVMASYETDVIATINGDQYAIRVHSLSESAAKSEQVDDVVVASDDDDYLNRLSLVEGRWPETAGECVISADRVMNTPTEIGDTITVTEGTGELDDTLTRTTYTVVGSVHSPYYVASSAMGSTSLGSGTIQQFMYVLPSDFAADYPITEAFVAVEGADDLFAGSDAYEERVDEVVAGIEAIAPSREEARYEQLRSYAQSDLDAARGEYETERNDALSQLDDAKAQLDDAGEAIAASEEEIASGQKDYDEAAAEIEAQRANVNEQIASSEETLAQNQSEVDEGRAELDSAEASLDEAWNQAGIDKDDAYDVLSQLNQSIFDIENNVIALRNQLSALNSAGAAGAAVSSADAEALSDQIAALEGEASTLRDQRDTLQGLIERQEAFDTTKAETTQRLNAAQTEINEGYAELASMRERSDQELADAEELLGNSAANLDEGRSALASGQGSYDEGMEQYEDSRAEVDSRLDDALSELDEAQETVDDIEHPEWLVMDRSQNYGVVSFASDADRVDSIASIFPFIFFLVAALVALTTMTRMVEEERVLIGTLKALGYSRARITSKYLVYAALASVSGAVVGIVVLSLVLPYVIMQAYSIVYYVPNGLPPINAPLALFSAALGIGVTLIATWAASLSTLREQPAFLMLPRVPKAGKRILLERVRPFWRRLSFSWKVTFRNIFRYKRRLVMTIIGIVGCTGLLLTGLGLHDAINDIIDKQYGELVEYNAVITGDEDMDDASLGDLEGLLSSDDVVDEYVRAQTTSMIAVDSSSSDPVVSLVVPEDPSAFQDIWLMRERANHNELSLSTEGVVVTEKLANTLDAGVGDVITLATQDDMGNATNETYELTVGAIMENYLYNYVFVTPQTYEAVFGEAPDYTSFYVTMGEDEDARASFNEQARAIDGVKTIAYNDETIDTYRTMLRSVDMVVVVLILSAAALAFIVLYNLTNISITERAREIATLKVLGFLPREVDMYIYRETMLLSVVGCLLGLVFGVFLEGFVVVTAEVDQAMFGREIHLLSYVLAFVLTMVFTAVVMLVMRRKLAGIDMVESLKSNE